jgi:tetratricopeptide (TPR) repeat protein
MFNLSPDETRKVYSVLTQGRDDCKEDKDYTAWKSKLTRTLEERFNKFLIPSNCVKGQLPFLCQEGAESLAGFVEKWLELLKPLTPKYDIAACHWYGYYLTRMGQLEKGMSELRRAHELDPLSPIINTELGWAFLWSRQYDHAIEQLRKTLELDPNFPRALEQLGEAYALQGKLAEAVEELIKAESIYGTSSNEIKTLREGFLVSGWEGYLRKQLDLAIKDAKLHGISAGYIATMYARLGNKEEAFKWLEKAYEAHEGEMGGLKVNPHWDNLRADPRFANLIRRVGLP